MVPGAAVVCAVSAAGCSDPLLSPNEDRTQYDQYDKMRDQYVAQDKFDERGRAHPNIRGRLLPKGY